MAIISEIINEREIAYQILQAGAVEIKDTDNGGGTFIYSSGNQGPGYVSIKDLVGQNPIFQMLCTQSTLRLIEQGAEFNFIAGNATGGMCPAYQVREEYQRYTNRRIPYVYVRNTRKIGGHQEYVVGFRNNPFILPNDRPLVYEELVNFSQTTVNSAKVMAEKGHIAQDAGTILHYENPQAIKALQDNNLRLIWTVRLKTVLDVAEDRKVFPSRAVQSYRDFLKDPRGWQLQRGITPPAQSGAEDG